MTTETNDLIKIRTNIADIVDQDGQTGLDDLVKLNQTAFDTRGYIITDSYFEDIKGSEAYIVSAHAEEIKGSIIALQGQSTFEMIEQGAPSSYVLRDKIAVGKNYQSNGVLGAMMNFAKHLSNGKQQTPNIWKTSCSEVSTKYSKHSDPGYQAEMNGYYIHGTGFMSIKSFMVVAHEVSIMKSTIFKK